METDEDFVEVEDSKVRFKNTVIRFIVTRYYMDLLLAVVIEALFYASSEFVFELPSTLKIFIILASIWWYFSAREEVVSEKRGSEVS